MSDLPSHLRSFLNKSSLKQKQPLKKEQVATLMHFCYSNAKDLFEEATILKKSEKYARALALCVLSLEEARENADSPQRIVFCAR